MSFTPFARYKNFTVENLKSLIEVYPDMQRQLTWNEAGDIIEEKNPKYKKTASQQTRQLGFDDRSSDKYRVQTYLFTFSDVNLANYLRFWIKTYYAPNPYVKSSDKAFIIYCELGKEILADKELEIDYHDFFVRKIGGKSEDILMNVIRDFCSPINYKKDPDSGKDIFYVDAQDTQVLADEINFIETNYPIADQTSKSDFFERYTYGNFCKFYDISPVLEEPDVSTNIVANKSSQNRELLPFDKSKECARQIIDMIYKVDSFDRIKNKMIVNDKTIKINTDSLGGNYLRFMFAKSSSTLFNATNEGKTRVFTDKDYNIVLDGISETVRLSTEWVSTKLGENGSSGNYLRALIAIVNDGYSDVLRIYEDEGNWYLELLNQVYELEKLPHEFQTTFAKRYLTSLLAKPFVILTGNSGTGKTRISRLFAEYLETCSDDNEKNWVLVPVGADWTDNTKILGFYNPLADEGKGKYEKTEILRLIEHANNNKSKPYFIILDEMNLSHVERYFADFLSHMETKKIPFVLDGYEGEVEYPSNLFVVGTVNIDETTYMFSPKVLDRANVIEFKPDESAVLDLFINLEKSKSITPANDGTAEAFLKLAISLRSGICNLEEDTLYDIQDLFRQIYKITEKYGYEFAYRTVKEIRQYIIASYEILDDKESFNLVAAEDEQLLQKVLPKIHGNKKEIGQLLEELDTLCEQKNLKLSQEKIKQMKGKLAKVQYASFI